MKYLTLALLSALFATTAVAEPDGQHALRSDKQEMLQDHKDIHDARATDGDVDAARDELKADRKENRTSSDNDDRREKRRQALKERREEKH